MTERRKSPQQKKAESYKKDRINISISGRKGPNASLQWIKAQEHRRLREVDRKQLSGLAGATSEADAEASYIPSRRRPVSHWRPIVLRDWIQNRRHYHLHRLASNFFKEPYSRGRHRTRFAAFLYSLTEGHSRHTREIAAFLSDLLDRRRLPTGEPWDQWWIARSAQIREWLDAFFRDEPEWEARLREWIARMMA